MKKSNWGWVVAVFVLLILLSNLKTSQMSAQVQFNNIPIIINASTNQTNPSYSVDFNNNILNITPTINNGTYTFNLGVISSEGAAHVTFQTASGTAEVYTTEIKNPYIYANISLPTLSTAGTTLYISMSTYNPQDVLTEADSVSMLITKPDSTTEIKQLTKSGNNFSITYSLPDKGAYIFEPTATKAGYTPKSTKSIVETTGENAIPFITYVWVGGILILVALFVVARIRRKKIGWKKNG